MRGIEADREQAHFRGERRILARLRVHLREIARDQRAEVGERASRVDERDEQDVALERAQMDSLAVLIGEREIGNFVAGRAARARWSAMALRRPCPFS